MILQRLCEWTPRESYRMSYYVVAFNLTNLFLASDSKSVRHLKTDSYEELSNEIGSAFECVAQYA